ncbi:FtsW/RodA/SpoVE family cell cycle protein [Parabacteroides pacaensis]|uniref:FtsW/RodA/SpoVE family cell cycle protein n=1 Tax=Parabacteroides pacaensis TaxID=2086575 RepID=UPI000D0FF4A9|nr:FtsW/RodA/SpoVE family cell cycle protein [Parabacteroides pacaensis]
MDLANKLFRGDRVIWIIFMFLCLISVVEVFSATSTLIYKNSNHWTPIVRHASFLLAGFVCVLVIHNIPYKYLSAFTILLPVSVIMLLVTPIFGVMENDAHRWLKILGFQFQPSEFAKLSAIVYIAFLLSRRPAMSDAQIFKWIIWGVGGVCILILPENFSTAFMLFGVCFLLMFIGEIPIKYLLKTAGVLFILLFVVLGIMFLAPKSMTQYLPDRISTWQARVERHFGSNAEEKVEEGTYKITDDNFQESHAKIAIARGGLIGKMPGHGQQRDFLPQAYSDFIYAIIIEEMGVLGGIFVLFLYIFLLVRVGIIARKCEKSFPKYLVLGCGLLIVVQALANMSVAVGLVPVTGQPLPLISRGGTSTMLTCVYFGIILSVSRFAAGMGEEDETTENEEEIVNEEFTQDIKTLEVNDKSDSVESLV